jgi:hypothetical protein
VKYLSLLLLLLPSYVFCQSDTLLESVQDGKLIFGIRFRVEHVDFDNFEKDATAATFRTVLGYQTASWRGLSFLAEFENIYAIDDDAYNSTENGVGNRPVVPDAEDTELNRAQLTYTFKEGHSVTMGRQRIILDDARFVGNVGWRQNEQTYDAVRYVAKRDKLKADVMYIANANRIFGENHPSRGDFRLTSYLGNVSYQASPSLKLSGFGYFFEYDNALPLSHSVVGVRAAGQYPAKEETALTYTFSYAQQSDYQNDLAEIDSDYIFASIGGKFGAWSISGNYELLGAGDNGGPAFFTPLATLHKFNGWADVFLGTPDAGLIDYHLQLQRKVKGLNFLLVYHQFESDEADFEYGSEINALLAGTINKKLSWGTKAAFYDPDDLGVEILKGWAWIAFKY